MAEGAHRLEYYLDARQILERFFCSNEHEAIGLGGLPKSMVLNIQ
jgi:hypothetical protein